MWKKTFSELLKRTIKLYDDAPYDREFTGRVINIREEEDSCIVILDRTLFFPEEGGQTSDRGRLNGFDVIRVDISDGII